MFFDCENFNCAKKMIVLLNKSLINITNIFTNHKCKENNKKKPLTYIFFNYFNLVKIFLNKNGHICYNLNLWRNEKNWIDLKIN